MMWASTFFLVLNNLGPIMVKLLTGNNWPKMVNGPKRVFFFGSILFFFGAFE